MSVSPTSTVVLPEAPQASQIDAVYRKVSWRLLPFLGLLWILAWLDRVNIGFAKLQMLDALKFSEAVYGLGAGIFFIGYFFFEVPSNMLLQKIGAKKTVMRITIGWGVICIMPPFARGWSWLLPGPHPASAIRRRSAYRRNRCGPSRSR